MMHFLVWSFFVQMTKGWGGGGTIISENRFLGPDICHQKCITHLLKKYAFSTLFIQFLSGF